MSTSQTPDIDLSATIQPKSDQLNADDLIAGPRTITITRVAASPSSPEQPVSIFFEGDDGKPYKPCKSMRRVLVFAWGPKALEYVGRSMTLFRDPRVTWGGMEVGGIRISHLSHIDADTTFALTESKKKRAPYTVRKLVTPAPAKQQPAHDKPPGDLSAVLRQIADASPELLPKIRERLNEFSWSREDKAAIRSAIETAQEGAR